MNPLAGYIQALETLFEQGLINTKPSLIPFKQGEIIIHAGEPAPMLFGVQTGKIQLVRYLENGQVSNQYALQSGAWFGEETLSNRTYQNSAIATQPSDILAVSKQTFLKLLRYEPEVSSLFVDQLVEQLHVAKTFMALRCIRSAHERVLAYLHTLKTPSSQACILARPIKEVAQQICLSPEVVSRSLRKLQDDGIIQRNQRKITFLDNSGLQI